VDRRQPGDVSAYPTSDLGAALAWAGGAVLVVLIVTFVVAKIAGKHSVIDTAWGLLFTVIAVTAFARSSGHGDPVRRALLLALPVLWGLRLAIHIGRRTIGRPEDPRYAALLAKAKGNRDLYAFAMVYLLQGVLAFLISAPILVGAFEPGPVRGLAWFGVALWAVGVFFESVGDQQLETFRRDPANRGKVMDVGLWRYTRHPNYFGDACTWWGMYLVAAERWPGLLTLAAPIVMTLLLTRGSGARILEKHMSTRAGWTEYAARTSAFIPRPPKGGSCRAGRSSR
jgi:steroid 5-alpha reductase family enzyme